MWEPGTPKGLLVMSEIWTPARAIDPRARKVALRWRDVWVVIDDSAALKRQRGDGRAAGDRSDDEDIYRWARETVMMDMDVRIS